MREIVSVALKPGNATARLSRAAASSCSHTLRRTTTRSCPPSLTSNSNPRQSCPLQSVSARCYSSTPPTQASGARSGIVTAILVGIVGAGAYVAGSLYPPTLMTLVKPRDLPPAPGMDTPEGMKWTADIEKQLHNIPLVKDLLSRGGNTSPAAANDVSVERIGDKPGANPSTRAVTLNTSNDVSKLQEPNWIASRPYRKFTAEKLLHSLTAGTLRGPGKFAIAPLVISKTPNGVLSEGGSEGDAYAFIHLGRSLCGHNGIIHGGLLATICDEALARTAFFALPSRIGVTAKLELNYKSPTHADQFVVIKTELKEAKGRKAIVTGVISDLKGNVLVEANAVFVEPKFAKLLDASMVKDAMDT
ncbi:unnamed protein product [Sympodiomycopsis kandeliae]